METLDFVTRATRPAVENVLWHRCVYLDAVMIGLQSMHCTIQSFTKLVAFKQLCFHRSNQLLTGRYVRPLPPIPLLTFHAVQSVLYTGVNHALGN